MARSPFFHHVPSVYVRLYQRLCVCVVCYYLDFIQQLRIVSASNRSNRISAHYTITEKKISFTIHYKANIIYQHCIFVYLASYKKYIMLLWYNIFFIIAMHFNITSVLSALFVFSLSESENLFHEKQNEKDSREIERFSRSFLFFYLILLVMMMMVLYARAEPNIKISSRTKFFPATVFAHQRF